MLCEFSRGCAVIASDLPIMGTFLRTYMDLGDFAHILERGLKFEQPSKLSSNWRMTSDSDDVFFVGQAGLARWGLRIVSSLPTRYARIISQLALCRTGLLGWRCWLL